MINDHNQLQQKVTEMGKVATVFQQTLANNIGQRSLLFWFSFVDGKVGGTAFGNISWEGITKAELEEVKLRLDGMISEMDKRLDDTDQILSDLFNSPTTS